MEKVYLSLGSNLGDSSSIIEKAIALISAVPQVQLIDVSAHYRTTAVSPIPQNDFINVACYLQTTLSPKNLYHALHHIEIALGKVPKPKNAPRIIDIDILFFGLHFLSSSLCIPHPRWKERQFVIIPLLDLTEEITIPLDNNGTTQTIYLKDHLSTRSNPYNEQVVRI